MTIAVSRHIKPMPAPALAVVWRSEQVVYKLSNSIRAIATGLCDKRIDLLRAGRQANKIEVDATDKYVGRCRQRRLKTRIAKLREHKTIDIVI